MTITKRTTKGSALTYAEMDENIRDLYEDTTLDRVVTNGNSTNRNVTLGNIQAGNYNGNNGTFAANVSANNLNITNSIQATTINVGSVFVNSVSLSNTIAAAIQYRPGEIIERIAAVADGRSVTVTSGTYTMDNVTTNTTMSGTYQSFGANINNYSPPSGTTVLEFSALVQTRHAVTDPIFHFKCQLDGVDYDFLNHSKTTVRYSTGAPEAPVLLTAIIGLQNSNWVDGPLEINSPYGNNSGASLVDISPDGNTIVISDNSSFVTTRYIYDSQGTEIANIQVGTTSYSYKWTTVDNDGMLLSGKDGGGNTVYIDRATLTEQFNFDADTSGSSFFHRHRVVAMNSLYIYNCNTAYYSNSSAYGSIEQRWRANGEFIRRVGVPTGTGTQIGSYQTFGQAIDCTEDTVIVGHPAWNNGDGTYGAAYIFNANLVYQSKLSPDTARSTGGAYNNYGCNVTLNDDFYIVVETEDTGFDHGLVHWYSRDGSYSNGTFDTYGGSRSSSVSYDQWGYDGDVAISNGNQLVISSREDYEDAGNVALLDLTLGDPQGSAVYINTAEAVWPTDHVNFGSSVDISDSGILAIGIDGAQGSSREGIAVQLHLGGTTGVGNGSPFIPGFGFWSTPKDIGFVGRWYDGSYYGKVNETNTWEGGGTDIVVPPKVTLNAIA